MGTIEILLAVAVSVVLAAAAFTDIRERRIPNALPIALIVLFVVALLLEPSLRGVVHWRLLSALVAFVAGFILFATGLMGGGDVKLFTALALWHPFSELSSLVFAMAIAGAGVALIFAAIEFVQRRQSSPTENSVLTDLRQSLKTRIPYGVAIFAAHLFLYL